MQRSSVTGLRARGALAAVLTAVVLGGCGSDPQTQVADLPAPTYPPSPAAEAAGHQAVAKSQSTPGVRTSAAARVNGAAAAALVPAPVSPVFDGLKPGDAGPSVLALQQRLSQLGFWVGDADGTYGDTTTQAVLALQKAVGLTRDGVMGPKSREALATGVSLQAHSSSGHWIEIDKGRQLLMLVDGGRVSTILNTSTGSDQPYSYGGHHYTANTPTGQFAVFRQVDRLDPGPLGDLWRPKYFNGGSAVHGAAAVPAYPASHGCARVSDAAMNWIWGTDKAAIGTRVWVY